MNTTATPRHIEVIYCDDIRLELGNKASLMGIYTGDLLVSAFPVVLPKLCLYVTAVTPIKEPFERLEITVELDGKPLIETGDVIATTPPVVERRPLDSDGDQATVRSTVLYMMFTLSPFRVESETKLRLLARTESGDYRGRALRVRLAPSDPATG